MGCRTVIKKFITNCTPTCPDVEDWVFSNANVDGEGVFYQQTGTAVEFYGIMNTDGYITVALDAANKAITIDLDPDLIAGSIPDATTTVKGKVELATDAEAQAKTDTARALTPSNLAAVTASTTATGLVELATSPETVTGTDTTRATTPAGVKAALDAVTAVQVVANAAARTAATPAYIGQQLYQTDSGKWYTGTSLISGGWASKVLTATADSQTVPSNFAIAGGGGTITWNPGDVTLSGFALFTATTYFLGPVVLYTGDTDLQIDDVSIPASSLLGTSGVAGEPASHLISNFLNSTSATAAYTITNDVTTRTYDADTVSTPELADVVATLIKDIEALTRPTT